MDKHNDLQPSAWVTQWAPLIPTAGKILEVACGRGRHLRYLSDRGQPLVGIDIDLSRVSDLKQQPGLELHEQDLEKDNAVFPDVAYAGIIVTNYLHRPLLKMLPDYLCQRGVLIYETFAVGNEKYGRPRSSDFLLRTDELLDVYSGCLNVVGFEQGFTDTPYPAVVQRVCAVKSE